MILTTLREINFSKYARSNRFAEKRPIRGLFLFLNGDSIEGMNRTDSFGEQNRSGDEHLLNLNIMQMIRVI